MTGVEWFIMVTVGRVFTFLAQFLFSNRSSRQKAKEKDLKRALEIRRSVSRSRLDGVRDDEIIYRD